MNELFKIEDKAIIFSDGVNISFTNRIIQHLQSDNILIVLIGYKSADKDVNENVFGISLKEKNVKWQIKNQTENDCPFNYIDITKTGEIALRNWCPYAMIINPQTGEVLRKVLDNAK